MNGGGGKLNIAFLGTRGIPNRHGGFETAVEQVAAVLVRRGWGVSVYCQEPGFGSIHATTDRRVTLVHVPAILRGSLGSIIHDTRSAFDLWRRRPDVVFWMGYNTGWLIAVARRLRIPVAVNVDGLEWRRAKWRWGSRMLLRVGEWCANRFADRIIADHPEIARYWKNRFEHPAIRVIPYGGDVEVPEDGDVLTRYGLKRDGYFLLIARLEPENSILEIVRGYSAQRRGMPLVIVGSLDTRNKYHRQLRLVASSEVNFVGSLYDPAGVKALRIGCRGYIHGHQVGGTNPTLVESLHSACAILYRDNPFNRWVVRSAGLPFDDSQGLSILVERLVDDDDEVSRLRVAALRRATDFSWATVAAGYAEVAAELAGRGPNTE